MKLRYAKNVWPHGNSDRILKDEYLKNVSLDFQAFVKAQCNNKEDWENKAPPGQLVRSKMTGMHLKDDRQILKGIYLRVDRKTGKFMPLI